jgi:hypothetical protein
MLQKRERVDSDLHHQISWIRMWVQGSQNEAKKYRHSCFKEL